MIRLFLHTLVHILALTEKHEIFKTAACVLQTVIEMYTCVGRGTMVISEKAESLKDKICKQMDCCQIQTSIVQKHVCKCFIGALMPCVCWKQCTLQTLNQISFFPHVRSSMGSFKLTSILLICHTICSVCPFPYWNCEHRLQLSVR